MWYISWHTTSTFKMANYKNLYIYSLRFSLFSFWDIWVSLKTLFSNSSKRSLLPSITLSPGSPFLPHLFLPGQQAWGRCRSLRLLLLGQAVGSSTQGPGAPCTRLHSHCLGLHTAPCFLTTRDNSVSCVHLPDRQIDCMFCNLDWGLVLVFLIPTSCSTPEATCVLEWQCHN